MNNIKNALVIRHVGFEDLGQLEAILLTHHYVIHYVDAGVDNLLSTDCPTADLLIILGAPISVNDVNKYPFIEDELHLIKKFLTNDQPLLGICLGCQLIAKALGAAIYPGATKEIGWAPLQIHSESNALLKCLDDPILNVLHWHGETFDLPQGATLLASTPEYPNQAFSWGKNTLALQFHLEVNASNIEKWLIGHAVEIDNTENLDVNNLRADTKQYAPQLKPLAELIFSNWLKQIK